MWTIDGLYVGSLVLDALCVIITYGLWLGPRSYMRTGWGWRVIDVFIILSNFIILVLPSVESDEDGARVVKLLKSIRLIAIIPRMKNMRVMADALLLALPRFSSVDLEAFPSYALLLPIFRLLPSPSNLLLPFSLDASFIP